MKCTSTRFQTSMVALVAASCMFAAAAPSWTQTNLPAANVGLPQSTSVTPATTPPTPIAKPTANPSLRMPKDLALPARANPLAPVDIAQENAGDIEKTLVFRLKNISVCIK